LKAFAPGDGIVFRAEACTDVGSKRIAAGSWDSQSACLRASSRTSSNMRMSAWQLRAITALDTVSRMRLSSVAAKEFVVGPRRTAVNIWSLSQACKPQVTHHTSHITYHISRVAHTHYTLQHSQPAVDHHIDHSLKLTNDIAAANSNASCDILNPPSLPSCTRCCSACSPEMASLGETKATLMSLCSLQSRE
jgi:hypothetical protein